METFKILIVNDSFIERFTLKTSIQLFLRSEVKNISVFSSSNSVEALGKAFISNPNLMIIDATLPKLSGGELAWFLDQYKDKLEEMSSMQTIITQEDDEASKFFPNFLGFSKGNRDFLGNLIKLIRINISESQTKDLKSPPVKQFDIHTKPGKVLLLFASRAIFWENRAANFFHKSKEKKISSIYRNSAWLLRKFAADTFFMFFLFLTFPILGKISEESIEQRKADLTELRVKYYPRILIGFIALGLIFLQIFAAITGISFLGKDSKIPFLSSIFGANQNPTEYLNITVIDLDGKPVPDAFVTIDQTTYATNSAGQISAPLFNKNIRTIEVRYNGNSYSYFIDIAQDGKAYTFTISSK